MMLKKKPTKEVSKKIKDTIKHEIPDVITPSMELYGELRRQERIQIAFRYCEWFTTITAMISTQEGAMQREIPEHCHMCFHQALDVIEDSLR